MRSHSMAATACWAHAPCLVFRLSHSMGSISIDMWEEEYNFLSHSIKSHPNCCCKMKSSHSCRVRIELIRLLVCQCFLLWFQRHSKRVKKFQIFVDENIFYVNLHSISKWFIICPHICHLGLSFYLLFIKECYTEHVNYFEILCYYSGNTSELIKFHTVYSSWHCEVANLYDELVLFNKDQCA